MTGKTKDDDRIVEGGKGTGYQLNSDQVFAGDVGFVIARASNDNGMIENTFTRNEAHPGDAIIGTGHSERLNCQGRFDGIIDQLACALIYAKKDRRASNRGARRVFDPDHEWCGQLFPRNGLANLPWRDGCKLVRGHHIPVRLAAIRMLHFIAHGLWPEGFAEHGVAAGNRTGKHVTCGTCLGGQLEITGAAPVGQVRPAAVESAQAYRRRQPW